MHSGSIKIRAAAKSDRYDLWLWRNHPEVRRWCFKNAKIPYEEHKSWFDGKMEDGNSNIYVAENEKGEKLGQVRFDMDKDAAFINVNLNPGYFGKNLGHRIIKLATELFLKERQNIRKVIAEVMEDNVVSIKAFQKTNYLINGRLWKKENKNMIALIYRNENKTN